ncbi:uncharacterized protein LOC111788571 [Cucurbita pepo subsp. pepo]|uniref:uncharacterized protein LOC111788571 n=1 Tax=Cucurbita pepo subsp. pepo TaxID=3664 RepID=UPI000C9D7C52|nr:uncharacterized protein LOC111788571 [Cucurbita pepo subsp. pepo]
MGGGEFVRAAAKMASAGNAGFRGSSTVPQFGKLLRGSSRPVSVSVGSSSPVSSAKTTASTEVEVLQKPMWEIDDWEFANFEDDLAMEAAGPKPRIVFGNVPSFEEAKEATTEVKEALDKVYLSSSPESCGLNQIVSSNSKLVPESCSTIQTSPQTSVPQHAIQAFRLLKESAEAQTVVASIASDPNVWNAMLGNEALKSFLQSYQTNKALEYQELSEKLEESPEVNFVKESKNESSNVFHETLEYIKTSIDDMLATASSFLQKVFGSSPSEVSGNDKATSGYSTAEIAMGSSIMGLVIVVIAALVAKRN